MKPGSNHQAAVKTRWFLPGFSTSKPGSTTKPPTSIFAFPEISPDDGLVHPNHQWLSSRSVNHDQLFSHHLGVLMDIDPNYRYVPDGAFT